MAQCPPMIKHSYYGLYDPSQLVSDWFCTDLNALRVFQGMKIIALTDELPICITTSEEGIKSCMITAYKTQARVDRASKILQTFHTEKSDTRVRIKPNFFLPLCDEWIKKQKNLPKNWDSASSTSERSKNTHTVFEDYDFHYVGRPSHENDVSIFRTYNCHPINSPRQLFSEIIKDVCTQKTYNSVTKNLEHSRIFQSYYEHNKTAAEVVGGLYEEGDFIWILSEDYLLVSALLNNKETDIIDCNKNIYIENIATQQPYDMLNYVVGMRFSLPFSSDLFRCIPFYRQLIGSMNYCMLIEFDSISSKNDYELLHYQKIRELQTEQNTEMDSDKSNSDTKSDLSQRDNRPENGKAKEGEEDLGEKEPEGKDDQPEQNSSAVSTEVSTSPSSSMKGGTPDFVFYKQNLPYLTHSKVGINKSSIDYVLEHMYSNPKSTENKRQIVVSACVKRLLCLEAYFMRSSDVQVFILNSLLCFDELAEIHRLIEYNKLKYNVSIEWFLPESDEELIELLKNTSICFCPEVEDICRYLGVTVISSNPVDYEKTAEEIEKASGDEKMSKDDVIDRRKWMDVFFHKLQVAYKQKRGQEVNNRGEAMHLFQMSENCKRRENMERQDGAEKHEPMNEDLRRCIGHNRTKITLIEQSVSALSDITIDTDPTSNYKRNSSDKEKNDENNSKSLDAIEAFFTKDFTELSKHFAEIKNDFEKNKKRTLILDYDGTLTDLTADPTKSAPDNMTVQLLLELNKRAKVVIATGRSTTDMDAWIPKEIEVYAEHGARHRVKGEWGETSVFPNLDEALKMARFIEARTPKSFLEEKGSGFSFHYRNCDPIIGKKQAKALYELLKRLCFDNVVDGKYIVEVRSSDKSVAVQNDGEFMLVAGDDVSDEDMFKVCGDKGYTVKVGDAETLARYRVSNPNQFKRFLSKLIKDSEM